ERELVAVATEKAPRTQGVALPGAEHVTADDPGATRPECVRVPQPRERAGREIGADLVVSPLGEAGLGVVVEPSVVAAPGGERLAEVVEEGGQPHSQRGGGGRGVATR